MVVAALLATWLVRRQQAELALSRSDRWTMIASAFVGATFAAKLPFLFHASASHSHQSRFGLAMAKPCCGDLLEVTPESKSVSG